MKRRMELWLCVVVGASGFVGGVVSNWLYAALAYGEQGVSPIISASEFRLVDKHGLLRGVLAAERNTPGESGLALFDHEGKERLNLYITPDGFGKLAILNSAGSTRISIAEGERDETAIYVLDPKGHPRAGLLVQSDGTPMLRLYETNLRQVITLALQPDGNPELTLGDNLGYKRISLRCDRTGLNFPSNACTSRIFDKYGDALVDLP